VPEDIKENYKEKRARQAIEGDVAMADYNAANDAKLENIVRLRRERLAREAMPKVIEKKKKAVTKRK
jgi:hypothetical protein